MQINTRPLAYEDLDRVCEIEEQSFSMPWKKQDFQEMIENDDSHYMVITLDDYIIGTAGYTFNGFEGYINNVAIDKAYRGRGYSKLLLLALLDEGRARNVFEYTLEVRVSNAPAIALYEALGFKTEGVRKRFYERPVEDANVMWLRQEL